MRKNKMYILASFMGLLITTLTVSTMVSASQGKFEDRGSNYDPARHEAMQEVHEAMQEILENRDYETWKEMIDSRPQITDYINEENFDKFVDMHNYMQEGNIEAAQKIKEELGLPGKGKGFGHGMHMGQKMGHHNLLEDK
jgi:hypothetical protein